MSVAWYIISMSKPRITFLEWLQEVVRRQDIARALGQEQRADVIDDIRTTDPEALARYRGQANTLEPWDQPQEGDIVDMGPGVKLSPDKYLRVIGSEGQNATALHRGQKIHIPFKSLYEIRRTPEGALWTRLTQRQAARTYFTKARMTERRGELERRKLTDIPQRPTDIPRSTALADFMRGGGAAASDPSAAPGMSPLDVLMGRGRAA